MKYLLITTTENRNTGDELIRIGVQNLIREIDHSLEFILIDKEKDDWVNNPIEFDKVILCGMPLFWNNEVSTSQTIGWWHPIMRGWISERKKDFLILGVGNAVGSMIDDLLMYGAAIQEAVSRAYAVTVRNFVGTHPELISSVCPSVFAVTERLPRKYRLCNFMPDGAHDKHFNPREAEEWHKVEKLLSDYCRENDFYFISHSPKNNSYERPERLGWNEDRIFQFDTAEEYLNIYAQASCYFGNRLHGAVVTASLGRQAIGIGYDSRTGMADIIGAITKPPSGVLYSDIERLINSEGQEDDKFILRFIEDEKQKNIELIGRFIAE